VGGTLGRTLEASSIESATAAESVAPVATLTTSGPTTSTAGDRGGARGSRNALRRGEAALVLLFVSALSVAWFWHTWVAPTTRTVGSGADSYPVMWFLAWVPYALGHGLNPLVTHYVNAPQGIDLMWNPLMPLLALLISPITVTAGPVVAYNVIATAAPALSGWAAYLAIRRWTGPTPAFAGALLFAFSPFVAAESADHVFLTFSMSAPLLLIVLDRLLVLQRAPAWRDGLLLGLLLWAQLLVDEELLVIELVVATTTITVAALLDLREIRSKLDHAARGLAIAAGVAGILSVWPLAVQFLGPKQPTQALHPVTIYSTDLWNFISPTMTTALHTSSALSLDQHFTGNWTEWGSYLGIPLIASLIGCLFLCRHRRVAWVGATIVTSAALLSLGPSLHIAGRDTGIPLPWTLVARLPVFRDLLPVRAAGMMFLGAGLLLAVGLDEVRRRGLVRRALGYGLAIFSLVVVAPIAPYYTTPLPSGSLDAANACPAHPGASIFLLSSGEMYTTLTQAEADFCFAVPTYFGFNGLPAGTSLVLGEASYAAVRGLPLPDLTPSLRARAARELLELKPSAVVIPPTPPPASQYAHARLIAWVTDLLGVAPRTDGDLLVWPHPHVPAAPTPEVAAAPAAP
jgi:hypothetical protein